MDVSLQGSTVDRSASEKEKLNACPTLKDNDFLEKKRTIDLGQEQKRIFMERLKRDVNVNLSLSRCSAADSGSSFSLVNTKWIILF